MLSCTKWCRSWQPTAKPKWIGCAQLQFVMTLQTQFSIILSQARVIPKRFLTSSLQLRFQCKFKLVHRDCLVSLLAHWDGLVSPLACWDCLVSLSAHWDCLVSPLACWDWFMKIGWFVEWFKEIASFTTVSLIAIREQTSKFKIRDFFCGCRTCTREKKRSHHSTSLLTASWLLERTLCGITYHCELLVFMHIAVQSCLSSNIILLNICTPGHLCKHT